MLGRPRKASASFGLRSSVTSPASSRRPTRPLSNELPNAPASVRSSNPRSLACCPTPVARARSP
eukprot:13134127-Alexandrium_andersonii.AAC.1